MQTVKVFKSGNSQAVRIPKNYSVSDEELYIQKIGDTIILTPIKDIWKNFENSIENFSDDLFEDGRQQPEMQKRESI